MEATLPAGIMGVIFSLLGSGLVVWGRIEEKAYYENITKRPDAKEFLTHLPFRPEPGGLKAGGYISLAIGLVMLVMALVFWQVW